VFLTAPHRLPVGERQTGVAGRDCVCVSTSDTLPWRRRTVPPRFSTPPEGFPYSIGPGRIPAVHHHSPPVSLIVHAFWFCWRRFVLRLCERTFNGVLRWWCERYHTPKVTAVVHLHATGGPVGCGSTMPHERWRSSTFTLPSPPLPLIPRYAARWCSGGPLHGHPTLCHAFHHAAHRTTCHTAGSPGRVRFPLPVRTDLQDGSGHPFGAAHAHTAPHRRALVKHRSRYHTPGLLLPLLPHLRCTTTPYKHPTPPPVLPFIYLPHWRCTLLFSAVERGTPAAVRALPLPYRHLLQLSCYALLPAQRTGTRIRCALVCTARLHHRRAYWTRAARRYPLVCALLRTRTRCTAHFLHAFAIYFNSSRTPARIARAVWPFGCFPVYMTHGWGGYPTTTLRMGHHACHYTVWFGSATARHL